MAESPRGRIGTITEKWRAVARLVFNLVNAFVPWSPFVVLGRG